VLTLLGLAVPSYASDFLDYLDAHVSFPRFNEFEANARIRRDECINGTPFTISQKSDRGLFHITAQGYADRIQRRLQDLEANGFVVTDFKSGLVIFRVDVIPLRCE
jgi:hypothetical protein